MKQYKKLHKEEDGYWYRKKKVESEPVENINKNPQSFQGASLVQEEVLWNKLQDHADK